MVKDLPANAREGEHGGRGEHGTQSSILAWRTPRDRGAWWATVHGVAESRTRLSDFTHSMLNETRKS